jgi:hypothetical protein
MSIKDVLTGEFDHLITRLEGEGHALAARFRALHGKLADAAPKVESEARTDAEHVVQDAVAAATPIVEEAVHDAKTVQADATLAVVHAGEHVLSSDALNHATPGEVLASVPAAPAEPAPAPTADAAPAPASAAEVTP